VDTVAQVCEQAARKLGPEDRAALGETEETPPKFRPHELRHSFATRAEEEGSVVYPKGHGGPGELISAVMGHTETTTRKRFYSGVRVPPMIKLPIRLVHPDDPRVAERGPRPPLVRLALLHHAEKRRGAASSSSTRTRAPSAWATRWINSSEGT